MFDVPRMVEMGQRFRRETSYAKHLRDNPEKMTQLANDLISKGTALISERDGKVIGMLLYIMTEHFLSGDLFSIEVAWWVEPEHRGEGPKLVAEMKRRSRNAGAKFYQMIAPTKEVENFYDHTGMVFVESAWQGSL